MDPYVTKMKRSFQRQSHFPYNEILEKLINFVSRGLFAKIKVFY